MVSTSFFFLTDAAELTSILFVLMLISIYIGYRIAVWKKKKYPMSGEDGSATIFGALLGLLGLLLAFTFGMAGSRFDDRRKVITEESNDIGTAILRCDLYPAEIRTELRAAFRNYVEARIAYLDYGIDLDKVKQAMDEKDRHAAVIWGIVTKYARENPSSFIASNQMIPALNDMIDVTTKRLALDTARVPEMISLLLFALSIICAFYGGYMLGHKGKVDWIMAFGLSLIICVVIFTTLDLERTRRGVTNLNANNRYVVQLRDMLKES